MAETFDPYSVWLGLRPGNRPPSYYQLLGLDDFEDDPQRIVAAADRTQNRLRAVRPGDQAKRWQRLLDEISLARLCLTEPGRKVQYDTTLENQLAGPGVQVTYEQARANPDLMPPGAAGKQPAAAPIVTTAAAPVPAAPVASAPMAAAPAAASGSAWPSAAPQPAPASPQAYIPQATAMPQAYAQQAYVPQAQVPVAYPQGIPRAAIPQAAMPQGMPVGQAVPGGGYAAQPNPFAQPVAYAQPATYAQPAAYAQPTTFVPQALAPSMAPSSPVSVRQTVSPATPAPTVSESAVELAVLGIGVKGPDRATKPAASNVWIFAVGGAVIALVVIVALVLRPGSGDGAGQHTPVAHVDSPEKEPTFSTADDPAPTRPAPAGETGSETPKKPKPIKKPRPPVVVAQTDTAGPGDSPKRPAADAGKSAELRKTLAVARGALANRDVPRARKEIDKARTLAQDGDEQTEVARMKTLATYVDGFWNAVRESIKGLQPTDELKFNNEVAAVVETGPEGLTLHTGGTNREYKLKTMPANMAMFLAQRWFDQTPANKLYLGAFQAVDPKGDKGAARQYWDQATAGGASAADLLPLLGGDMEAPPPDGDLARPPDEKQLTMALKRVKETFQADYSTAKTPDRKAELALQLINVAGETENQVEQFAMLREAGELAAAGANPAAVLQAADDLARRFQVDGLELKAEGLLKAAKAANNPLAARDVAQNALDLADEAIRNKRAKAAGKLGQAALTAAKKSKDAGLVKAANGRVQKAQELK